MRRLVGSILALGIAACGGQNSVDGPCDTASGTCPSDDAGQADSLLVDAASDRPSDNVSVDREVANAKDDSPGDVSKDLDASVADGQAADRVESGAVDIAIDETSTVDAVDVADGPTDAAIGTNADAQDATMDTPVDVTDAAISDTFVDAANDGANADAGACLCAPGETQTEDCGTDVGTCTKGTRHRTCSSSCVWAAWDACGGTYAGPVPEICGDSADNNCNGLSDEWCSCTAIAKGASSFFTLSGTIWKLVADPGACLVYSLGTDSLKPDIVVLDAAARKELVHIAVAEPGHDLDISPNGKWLVAALDTQLAVIDKASWSSKSFPLALRPEQIEVSDAGIVYYTTGYDWSKLNKVDLNVGPSSNTLLVSSTIHNPALELNAAGDFLYSGDYGISGAKLLKWNFAGQAGDSDIWEDGYGFANLDQHLYLGKSGKHIYFADYSVDADQLAFVRGSTKQRVFVEDKAGKFAVGTTTAFDAALVRSVATFTEEALAATLVAGDQELWRYTYLFRDNTDFVSRIDYTNVGDFLDGKALGVRELPAEPLANFAFTKLIADPIRPRLYGLDAARELVVSIDTSTMTALGAIIVGSTPTEMAFDGAAQKLYVGHRDTLGLAVIDLATWQFSQYLPSRRIANHIATLNGGHVAIIDYDQWTKATLIDGVTGADLDFGPLIYFGAMVATADGATVFMADIASASAAVHRYSVTGGTFTNGVSSVDYPSATSLVVTPDGSGVYYAGQFLDGNDLVTVRYAQADEIVTVSPNGLLAISSTSVYRVSDGALRGALPVSGAVQAVKPDSAKLYLATPTGVTTVDLTGF